MRRNVLIALLFALLVGGGFAAYKQRHKPRPTLETKPTLPTKPGNPEDPGYQAPTTPSTPTIPV